ncbi:hypothetical protein CALVIDRAFT_215990 [Calocera viscosa TUFC12733]|uniref:Uncharacterized protein n=1 Tax=Calocera viscosa (strain TUFC12733) TaxID=1330018 RepID=A0A167RG46_CALVF|nr:hypothetical protein CALVIDRAFT_215990 [Calocera viscosa TUFC12733]
MDQLTQMTTFTATGAIIGQWLLGMSTMVCAVLLYLLTYVQAASSRASARIFFGWLPRELLGQAGIALGLTLFDYIYFSFRNMRFVVGLVDADQTNVTLAMYYIDATNWRFIGSVVAWLCKTAFADCVMLLRAVKLFQNNDKLGGVYGYYGVLAVLSALYMGTLGALLPAHTGWSLTQSSGRHRHVGRPSPAERSDVRRPAGAERDILHVHPLRVQRARHSAHLLRLLARDELPVQDDDRCAARAPLLLSGQHALHSAHHSPRRTIPETAPLRLLLVRHHPAAHDNVIHGADASHGLRARHPPSVQHAKVDQRASSYPSSPLLILFPEVAQPLTPNIDERHPRRLGRDIRLRQTGKRPRSEPDGRDDEYPDGRAGRAKRGDEAKGTRVGRRFLFCAVNSSLPLFDEALRRREEHTTQGETEQVGRNGLGL